METRLDVIAPHARYKVWIRPNGEMPFLYGGHVLKAHTLRWSEDCPENSGCVVFSQDDTPLVSIPSAQLANLLSLTVSREYVNAITRTYVQGQQLIRE